MRTKVGVIPTFSNTAISSIRGIFLTHTIFHILLQMNCQDLTGNKTPLVPSAGSSNLPQHKVKQVFLLVKLEK